MHFLLKLHTVSMNMVLLVNKPYVSGVTLRKHPLSREHFSLKIDVRDQTIWNCILELQLFYSSQMKLKLAGLFFQKSTRWRWAQSKMHRIKKITPRTEQTFRDRQLCFYVKKLFVSEKTQKSELCHFSQKIYVIKFFPARI